MRVANLLILACIGLTLAAWVFGEKFTEQYLAFSGANLAKGRGWTIISALFIHASLLHLAGNMLFLFVFGNTLERIGGADKMLTAFFLGGVASFLLSLPFYPAFAEMIGASAAIFTLTAVVMLMKPLKFSWLFLMPVGLVAILYFLYNALAIYYRIQSNVAFISHVIGFGLGMPLGIIWSESWKKNLLISILLLIAYLQVLQLVSPFLQ